MLGEYTTRLATSLGLPSHTRALLAPQPKQTSPNNWPRLFPFVNGSANQVYAPSRIAANVSKHSADAGVLHHWHKTLLHACIRKQGIAAVPSATHGWHVLCTK